MSVDILPPGLNGPVATVAASVPASLRSSLCAGWRRLLRWNARIEDSLIGDALGVLFLFSELVAFLWLAPLFGPFLQ
ncbi:hypothetical protein SAMN05421763_103323 [[Luteovulum] sphaeroides subsp. megalophilum]|uniref:hypothetical protein n=1 Tax=Cereibacter sphaeroides TaxID=1063 RepID=UPI000B644EB3|nr:hypothetical protein [Cereibacter sphaeroides]SNS87720.1 hypothetical protein SAMN05421763_103323 [[Luteovulum] sphaeroides subsp. megalophilum]